METTFANPHAIGITPPIPYGPALIKELPPELQARKLFIGRLLDTDEE